MKIHNILVPTLLVLLMGSCGSNSEDKKDAFSLEIKNQKKAYTTEDVLTISLNNKKNIETDSVVYFLNKDRVSITDNTLSLSGKKLGEKTLRAQIYSDDETYEASTKVTILSSIKPKLYTYKVLETYPHDINAYTQGLEFENDTLYESTGQYKESSLRKTDYRTGEVLQKVSLPDQYFGEGLTILNNKIYQLTWRENTGFIYNLKTMEQTGTFVYGESKEGWGLCHDAEKNIYKSDGTDRIWTLNSNTLAEKDYIEIFTNTSKISSVNELEWVDGKIYANVYQQGSIAIIDPSNGAVEGVIDLTDLKDKVTQHPKLDVLNGIAYNGEPNILYITGKNWDKLFKIEILLK
ncbi:MAG: glutamine cyclotransferase [Aequorivita sp.]|nr:glutamine cyclotransferase [Aequorivita sp.]MBP41324.1 glutamine cyclotransferase [Aequorivita sp.]HBC04236.1 glutamine cyclotransferase [Aequorivita sp.]|tara:strand:- start:9886 stop:10932 length:1047 start_codon:yes stop_codon:yes gene_type:complete